MSLAPVTKALANGQTASFEIPLPLQMEFSEMVKASRLIFDDHSWPLGGSNASRGRGRGDFPYKSDDGVEGIRWIWAGTDHFGGGDYFRETPIGYGTETAFVRLGVNLQRWAHRALFRVLADLAQNGLLRVPIRIEGNDLERTFDTSAQNYPPLETEDQRRLGLCKETGALISRLDWHFDTSTILIGSIQDAPGLEIAQRSNVKRRHGIPLMTHIALAAGTPLSAATNGQVQPTYHRVVTPADADRTAITFRVQALTGRVFSHLATMDTSILHEAGRAANQIDVSTLASANMPAIAL